jgi:hypothetical protein
MQPHEMVAMQNQTQNLDSLYVNANKPVPVKKAPLPPINQNRVMYKVIFDPAPHYMPETRKLGLKLTPDKEYNVHQVVQHPTGKLELQKIALTDDSGKVAIVEEKFFIASGTGLLADKQLNFSGSSGRDVRKPKLAFEDEMVMDTSDPRAYGSSNRSFPIDDGSIPDDLLAVPDLRSRR